MSFTWEKKGLIFDPSNRFDWMAAYSQVPTVLDKKSFLRIYFTSRSVPDVSGKFVSYTSYIDVDKENPSEVIYIHDKPILDLGRPGTFDEFGIHPTSVVESGDEVLLYYTGWSRGTTVPYETWIGVAISKDGGDTFARLSEGPVIGKNMADPFLANGAYVFKEDNYIMIYASAKGWITEAGKLEPVYTLKKAVSTDGINWSIENKNILPHIFDNECISRPAVIHLNDGYHIWFGYRGVKNFHGGDYSYRIGYATSTDLQTWERKDEAAGIELSEEGWDSVMMSYPQVVKVDNRVLMFYNGNEFGKRGFGYAVLKN